LLGFFIVLRGLNVAESRYNGLYYAGDLTVGISDVQEGVYVAEILPLFT
jgi:hypothetical protein